MKLTAKQLRQIIMAGSTSLREEVSPNRAATVQAFPGLSGAQCTKIERWMMMPASKGYSIETLEGDDRATLLKDGEPAPELKGFILKIAMR